jgi:hypothetical protein
VLEALRALRLELEALAEEIRGSARLTVTTAAVLQRVQLFFLSWSNLKQRLSAAGVPKEVTARADRFFGELVRLTSSRSRKQNYLRTLHAIRQVFGQLLLEIARIQASPEPPKAYAAAVGLIPEIPCLTNDLLPNALYGWAAGMREFLRRFNYENNVFVMVAYRARLGTLIERIEGTLRDLGLNAIIARDHRLTDDLYNPIACLLCCRYGIAVFDRGEIGQKHNANIVYELAVMQMLKRPCMILKHQALRSMPSDFLHRLYESYASVDEAAQRVNEWWERTRNQ